jgi:hypothetical protein
MASTSRIALVMMDTRPAFVPTRAAQPQYPQLAFALNRMYACKHGYDLLYLRMRSSVCSHGPHERHPSYCKLAAVAEALSRGYTLVAFMDSDAFFQNASLPLPRLLDDFADIPTNSSGTSRRPLSKRRWDVRFASDRPFSLGPNAGVQFWRNTPSAWRLLTLWWHLPGGRYHTEHDYEQHALQWGLLHLHGVRIGTLRLQSMAAQLDARGWPRYDDPIAHVDHGRHFFRALLMSIALLRATSPRRASNPGRAFSALTSAAFEPSRGQGHGRHTAVLQDGPPAERRAL